MNVPFYGMLRLNYTEELYRCNIDYTSIHVLLQVIYHTPPKRFINEAIIRL
jgi:uncharacterized membrane protein